MGAKGGTGPGEGQVRGAREDVRPALLVHDDEVSEVGGRTPLVDGAGRGSTAGEDAVPVVGPAARPVLRPRLALRPFLLRTAVALLAAAAWELYVRSNGTYATPTIPDIVAALVDLPTQDGFWSSIWGTVQALLIGYTLSLALGLPLGVLMGRIRPIGRIVNVYMTILLSVPLSAVVPIVVILFGISLRARVAVIVLFALPVLVVNVMTGVSNVDRGLLEMANSFGWRRWGVSRKVILPAAMPEIFTGLRLAAGRSVVGMVVAELIVISVGVGKLIDFYTARFDMASTYAVVIVVLLIAAIFLQLVRAVERRVLSWRVTVAESARS